MANGNRNDDVYIDANGCPTERITTPWGYDVIVHYDDIPESDITCVRGIRCTTPLRTIIDIAAAHDRAEVELMVRHCLERRLFTRDEAMNRISRPDMHSRPGAEVLRQILCALP
jgi:hypothetical protein